MTATDKLDRLLCARAVLKGVIADLELALGPSAAYPVTEHVLRAIDSCDCVAEGIER